LNAAAVNPNAAYSRTRRRVDKKDINASPPPNQPNTCTLSRKRGGAARCLASEDDLAENGSDIRACCWLEVGAQNRLRRDAGFERVQRAQNSLVSTPTTKSSCLSDIAKAPVSHGVEPHDLATGPGLRVPLSAHRPPPRTRRPYRASGLVLTSTPDGYGASRLRRLQPVRMGKERCSPTACQTAQISRNGARRDTPMSTWLSPRRPIRSTELSFAPRTTIRLAQRHSPVAPLPRAFRAWPLSAATLDSRRGTAQRLGVS
jgi:hypothetical protein